MYVWPNLKQRAARIGSLSSQEDQPRQKETPQGGTIRGELEFFYTPKNLGSPIIDSKQKNAFVRTVFCSLLLQALKRVLALLIQKEEQNGYVQL